MYKMKKSVKRKCKRTKYNKCKMHHKNKKTHARSQRGGTIEQAYDSEIARCTACNDEHIIDLISMLFTGCLTFRKLLEARNKQTPSLKQIVCRQLPDEQIRMAETLFGLQSGFEKTWPEFVIILTRMVKTHSAPTGITTPPNTMMSPSSKPEKEDWRPVMVPRPILPEGWTQSGPPERPIYFTVSTGQGQYEFPTMPAREFELAQRLAQIRDPNYIPPPLTEKDQASAKQADAWLPNLPDISASDRMMAFRLDDD